MVGVAEQPATSVSDRVRRTVALLRRRGYAVTLTRLAEVCIGGPLAEREVRWAIAANPQLAVADDLVVERDEIDRAADIRRRARTHLTAAAPYVKSSVEFIHSLVAAAPFIRSVSIAGSLASGGFRDSDDVDLNLIVDDGKRHLAYVVVNFMGVMHALAHRDKPVDDLTRRPIAPRLMTANLILEHSQCLPLQRQDENMAFELLIAEPVFGADVVNEVITANPLLLEHFPQLAEKPAALVIAPPRMRLPAALYPRTLDGLARVLGETAWRYMQWTRRNRPAALARVAYVRSTMRPYALFDT